MDNFKITKTILENINEQNDRINECVDIVNGYTTDEETRVNQEIQRQQNELKREEQYNNINNKFVSINEQLETITQDVSITVTVGSGGNYETINEALEFLSRKTLKYNKDGFKAEILLKSGFVMREQVYVKNLNLGFITISSEDSEVNIDASDFIINVNEEPYGNSGYPMQSASAFTGYGNAVMPVLNVLFNFNGTGIAGKTNGIFLIYGATGRIERKKGFKNGKGGYGIMEGSRLYATETICTGHENNGISCFRGSYILFRAGQSTNNGEYGAYLDNGCTMDCISANFSNNGESGIWCGGQSIVSANRTTITGNGRHGITADYCGIIDAHSSNISNNAQRGISCDNARISANKALINGNGKEGVNVTNNGMVDCKEADLTGNLGSNNVYANYGGICNVGKAKVQKVEGVNNADLRVGSGGIIYAHGITDSGYSGASPNTLSNNGLIFTSDAIQGDVGDLGTITSRVVFSKDNSGVNSSIFPLKSASLKNITITGVNPHNSGALTSEEIALITIDKLTTGICFWTNDATLRTKLANTSCKFTIKATLI